MNTCIYKRGDLRERQSSLWFHEITSAHVTSGGHKRANPSSSLKHAGLNITIYLLVPKLNQDMVWSGVTYRQMFCPHGEGMLRQLEQRLPIIHLLPAVDV